MVLTTQRRIIAGVGVFLGLICIFYFLVYIPQIEHREDLMNKISQENLRLLKLEGKIRELEELKKERERLSQELALLEKKIKETQASFLYELGMRGKVYGIEYTSIVPLKTEEKNYYFVTPVNVHLYGRYHNLGMLISDMARRGGLGSFTVDNFLIKASSMEGYTIEANLSISLYKYRGSLLSGKKEEVSLSSKSNLTSADRRRRR
ncbi:MAG TPA: hypothetical protein ENL39_02220 [Candidatus Aerophobetes bacterium]|uniref:Type 4a pilus biogenesis protein PilO n=1 Tax=Aerophobetes bacterium TaxID=2030807 RepID=A0A7V5I0N2_UNCAE|nr:hypothetical protein [Candidatus Aerophobetes bacterium]